jgi:hypothetical protein
VSSPVDINGIEARTAERYRVAGKASKQNLIGLEVSQ